jgi:hypothetical protein
VSREFANSVISDLKIGRGLARRQCRKKKNQRPQPITHCPLIGKGKIQKEAPCQSMDNA